MSAAVSEPATTVTEATWAGGRPVRASTRCCPRWAVPLVATAPENTGITARMRLGSAGSSTPMRHGSPSASRVRQMRSPPAERQKSVSSSARRGGRGPFCCPALHDAGGVEADAPVGAGQPHAERAAGLLLRGGTQGEYLGHLGRAALHADLASAQSGDVGVVPVGAEHAVDLVQLR